MNYELVIGCFICAVLGSQSLVFGCATPTTCQTPIELQSAKGKGLPGQPAFVPTIAEPYIEFTLPGGTYLIYTAIGDSSEEFAVEFTNLFGSGNIQIDCKTNSANLRTYQFIPELTTSVRVRPEAAVSNIVMKGCKLYRFGVTHRTDTCPDCL